MMDAIGKPHLLGVGAEVLKAIAGSVTAVVFDHLFDAAPDPQIVFVILVIHDIPPGQCRLGEVIEQLLLLAIEIIETRYLIAQNADIRKSTCLIGEILRCNMIRLRRKMLPLKPTEASEPPIRSS